MYRLTKLQHLAKNLINTDFFFLLGFPKPASGDRNQQLIVTSCSNKRTAPNTLIQMHVIDSPECFVQ